ncbi:HD domain-containing protein [Paenibacillus sp. SAFN-117]|uniref:HD domain-containing protein n=1 Tax=Paenibacillus sp. SAFN-117 TaxID=3436860 RepID=UPI003F7D8EF4
MAKVKGKLEVRSESIKRNIPFIQIPLPEWFEPVVRTIWDKMKRDSTGHDFFHAVRVMELAVDMSDELAVDREMTMTAGLLHDYYREEEKESGLLFMRKSCTVLVLTEPDDLNRSKRAFRSF